MATFGKTSRENLAGLHPDLLKVMYEAIKETPVDFRVIDGWRTLAEQKEMVRRGASKTMRSRHLTGKAVDVMALVNGKGRWESPLYIKIGAHVKSIAKKLGITITWGGDWSFKDYGHFELDKNKYGY